LSSQNPLVAGKGVNHEDTKAQRGEKTKICYCGHFIPALAAVSGSISCRAFITSPRIQPLVGLLDAGVSVSISRRTGTAGFASLLYRNRIVIWKSSVLKSAPHKLLMTTGRNTCGAAPRLPRTSEASIRSPRFLSCNQTSSIPLPRQIYPSYHS
jgi:hypothetical protein